MLGLALSGVRFIFKSVGTLKIRSKDLYKKPRLFIQIFLQFITSGFGYLSTPVADRAVLEVLKNAFKARPAYS